MEILVGADPEAFLVNTKGEFISAIDKIGGSKIEPMDVGDGIALQEDNVAVEWNILPSKTVDEFIAQNELAMSKIQDLIKSQGLFLDLSASAMFTPRELEHPRAQSFGCDPDFNAWTGKINPRPTTNDPTLRVCGGHIHIGAKADRINVIKAMDAICGVPMSFVDKDTLRRKLYGKAGAFRPKEYGVEYRTLSNFWLTDESLMGFVFDCARNAVELSKNKDFLEAVDIYGKQIRGAINQNNRVYAHSVYDKFSDYIPHNEMIEDAVYA